MDSSPDRVTFHSKRVNNHSHEIELSFYSETEFTPRTSEIFTPVYLEFIMQLIEWKRCRWWNWNPIILCKAVKLCYTNINTIRTDYYVNLLKFDAMLGSHFGTLFDCMRWRHHCMYCATIAGNRQSCFILESFNHSESHILKSQLQF